MSYHILKVLPDIFYCGLGVQNPCSPFYAGPGPFSEIETRNVRDAILKLKKDIQLFISVQSHGQGVIAPGMMRGYQENEHIEFQV